MGRAGRLLAGQRLGSDILILTEIVVDHRNSLALKLYTVCVWRGLQHVPGFAVDWITDGDVSAGSLLSGRPATKPVQRSRPSAEILLIQPYIPLGL